VLPPKLLRKPYNVMNSRPRADRSPNSLFIYSRSSLLDSDMFFLAAVQETPLFLPDPTIVLVFLLYRITKSVYLDQYHSLKIAFMLMIRGINSWLILFKESTIAQNLYVP
jgi:hypothetical protein